MEGVIRTLKNNKTPGNDGFPAEFYKTYAASLARHLAGKLPPSWNDATVVVLPKGERDLSDPKSYHPISLLNQDYKLFTTLLTKWLNTIITQYVHQDQSSLFWEGTY